MKNLAITVSIESSIDLLKPFADVIILNTDSISNITAIYDTIYIRSHFSHPSMLPQAFRSEIEYIVEQVKRLNPQVKFIDGMDTIDAIASFEDKWRQYKTFGDLMPRTDLYKHGLDTSSFVNPLFKKRLSSRGSGVTWNKEHADDTTGDWIVQESLNIKEELRVYVICGKVYQTGAVRRSMTSEQNTQATSSRNLTTDEIDFSLKVMAQAPSLNIVGLDIARTADNKLSLIEVNRSPGFAKFNELSGVNLARILYEEISS